ncbi:hypothetical protein V1478_012091 [Vespula squamosa]|uniref:Uncharacterized protein n=1 Tax=Vespula squamosa TaxID=30214 RepID=A0ABD2ACG2_VESSQ
MEERNDRKAKVNSKRTVNFVHIYGTLRVSRTMFVRKKERKREKALIEVNAKKEIGTTGYCRRIDRNEVRTGIQEEGISQEERNYGVCEEDGERKGGPKGLLVPDYMKREGGNGMQKQNE